MHRIVGSVVCLQSPQVFCWRWCAVCPCRTGSLPSLCRWRPRRPCSRTATQSHLLYCSSPHCPRYRGGISFYHASCNNIVDFLLLVYNWKSMSMLPFVFLQPWRSRRIWKGTRLDRIWSGLGKRNSIKTQAIWQFGKHLPGKISWVNSLQLKLASVRRGSPQTVS